MFGNLPRTGNISDDASQASSKMRELFTVPIEADSKILAREVIEGEVGTLFGAVSHRNLKAQSDAYKHMEFKLDIPHLGPEPLGLLDMVENRVELNRRREHKLDAHAETNRADADKCREEMARYDPSSGHDQRRGGIQMKHEQPRGDWDSDLNGLRLP